MATGQQGELVAVVNDTNPKSNGKAYSVKISGNNHSQLLGKKIGDVVDGIFVIDGIFMPSQINAITINTTFNNKYPACLKNACIILALPP